MALIKCAECGKEISDKATNCMNCGCPTDKKKNMLKSTTKKTNYFKLYINSLKNKNKKSIIFTSLAILIIIVFSYNIFFRETTLYRFSNDYEVYESITLKSFGKCYYYYSNFEDEYKDKIDNICSYKKNGTSYTITISGKVLYCNKQDEKYNCNYNNKTITFKVD